MKNTCLNEQELTLHYYGELPEDNRQRMHLAGCPQCTERFIALSRDLAQLPVLDYPVHPATSTRLAARVIDQAHKPRRRWLPAISATAVSVCVLALSFVVWSPQDNLPQTAQTVVSAPATINFDEEMPDIEFLENMDLLLELDLLSQVEGV